MAIFLQRAKLSQGTHRKPKVILHHRRRFGTNLDERAGEDCCTTRIYMAAHCCAPFFYLSSLYTHNSCLVSMYHKINSEKSFCNFLHWKSICNRFLSVTSTTLQWFTDGEKKKQKKMRSFFFSLILHRCAQFFGPMNFDVTHEID